MLWPLLESVPNTRVLTSGEEDVSQDVSAALQNFIIKMSVKDFTQIKIAASCDSDLVACRFNFQEKVRESNSKSNWNMTSSVKLCAFLNHIR